MQRTIVFAAAILIVWISTSSDGIAASGGQFELPISQNNRVRYSKQSGLRLQIDTAWVGKHGYRPVNFTFKSLLPTPADVQLTVRFSAGRQWDKNPAIIVEQDFELATGNTSSTFTIRVPEYIEWRYIGCETWVDGVKDNELSMELVQHPQGSNSRGGNLSAMLLGIDIDLPTQLLQDVRGESVEFYPESIHTLPTKWFDYSSFDLVISNRRNINALKEVWPERFAELLHWTYSGGNLWILDGGESYQHVPEIDFTLGLASAEVTDPISPELLLQLGWRFPKVDNPGTDAIEKLSQLQAPYSTLREETSEQEIKQSPRDSQDWFASRLYGMGTITVFRGPLNRRPAIEETSWAINQSLLADRLSWVGRHGNDPDRGNDNFNDWLIPDVGTAPVTAFQALLTLFVLGIGPLNYYLLKRREKLPLLLLTVPVAAFATIFMLLIYSYMSDGFGVLVRARSFTHLDQRSGTAACWTRLSYFAGIAPAEGLELPGDTLVYPILPASRAGNRRMIRNLAQQQRELHWNGSEKLVDGWLASRTPTQYLTITSRQTPKQIDFEATSAGLQAKNQLGADIRMLVVVDAEGKFYLAKDLLSDELLQLPETTQVQASMQLRSLFSDNEPEFPPGTLESLSQGDNTHSFPLQQNLMETQISAISSAGSKGWNPRTFIAITTHGIELSLGLKNITESASFHVVRGEW